MERFSRELVENLRTGAEVFAVTNGSGKAVLPAFLPYAAHRVWRRAAAGGLDHVHLCDALLAPVGVLLKRLTGLPVTVSVHGLDLTYANPAYRRAIGATLPKLDLVVAGSEYTRGVAAGLYGLANTTVVNYGVAEPLPAVGGLPSDLAARLDGRDVVLTVGRLVRRKGVLWFVQNVLPRLSENAVYVAVGEGPDRPAIEAAAADLGLTSRLVLTGRVEPGVIDALHARADVFAMPNIEVPHDVEGFGLVALEASMAGLPVVASRLQGVTDAVRHGLNGVTVESGDAVAFAAAISGLLSLPPEERRAIGGRFQAYTRANYSWRRMAEGYLDAFAATAMGAPATRRAA
jgi:phosphatidylinositol alpha-1,6-mannosyltransferase